MQEAEVAQQLLADLRANLGIIVTAFVVLLTVGLIAVTASLSNATRALRDLRGVLNNPAGPNTQQAFQAQPRLPARTSDYSFTGARPAEPRQDILIRRHPARPSRHPASIREAGAYHMAMIKARPRHLGTRRNIV